MPCPSHCPVDCRLRGNDGEGCWNDGAVCWLVLSCSPSDPSVRHWDRLFDSSSIKGEGNNGGWFGLLLPRVAHRPSGLRIKSAMTGPMLVHRFTLTFDSSSIKGKGYMVGVVLFTRVMYHPSGLRIKFAITYWSNLNSICQPRCFFWCWRDDESSCAFTSGEWVAPWSVGFRRVGLELLQRILIYRDA